MDAFRFLLKQHLELDLTPCLEEVLQKLREMNEFFEYKNHSQHIFIPLKKVCYFESELRKVNIYGTQPNVKLGSFYCRFVDLVQQLESCQFLQIGKSDLVNMAYIQRISSYQVVLVNGVEKAVSRKDYQNIKRRFIEWKGPL